MNIAISTLVTCFASLPVSGEIRETVDLVEVNHFYDEHRRHVFDQMIFYQWSDSAGRFQVQAWRLIKSEQQLPTRQWSTGRYQVLWRDGDIVRNIIADDYRETWTQYDPELIERNFLPRDQRQDLRALTLGDSAP